MAPTDVAGSLPAVLAEEVEPAVVADAVVGVDGDVRFAGFTGGVSQAGPRQWLGGMGGGDGTHPVEVGGCLEGCDQRRVGIGEDDLGRTGRREVDVTHGSDVRGARAEPRRQRVVRKASRISVRRTISSEGPSGSSGSPLLKRL